MSNVVPEPEELDDIVDAEPECASCAQLITNPSEAWTDGEQFWHRRCALAEDEITESEL